MATSVHLAVYFMKVQRLMELTVFCIKYDCIIFSVRDNFVFSVFALCLPEEVFR